MSTAIILCAGSSRRFYPDGGATRPKCLLPVAHGETLLTRLLRQTAALGHDAVLGTGLGREQVEAAVAGRPRVRTLFNPEFATTNSIVTLWCAREHVRDDTLIVNGDLLVDDPVLGRFGADAVPQVLVKHLPAFDDDTYRVAFGPGRRVQRMGKDLRDPPSAQCAAFLGASRVGNARLFLAAIEALLAEGENQTWPTTGYRRLAGAGAEVRAVDIGDAMFFDIDTLPEYEEARRTLERRETAPGTTARAGH